MAKLTEIKEISFDNDDKNLFLIDDLQLKANAIRHSILPKLEIVLNHTIGRINEIYGTNVLELSTVLKSPSFRTVRSKDVAVDYSYSIVGLGGRRSSTLWRNVKGKDAVNGFILPFCLSFSLDDYGLYVYFSSSRYNMSFDKNRELIQQIYDFHINYKTEIDAILSESSFRIFHNLDIYRQFVLAPVEEYLTYFIENKKWNIFYMSELMKYPVSNEDISILANDLIKFYPIYESYIRIACNRPIIIKEQIEKLKKWLIAKTEYNDTYVKEASSYNREHLLKLADKKIKVMPAIRWQVFQRDGWKCVSCGRSSKDNVILHVDHILPRSKGGSDSFDNYQTLCETCNIGKSNKDQTDLRST